MSDDSQASTSEFSTDDEEVYANAPDPQASTIEFSTDDEEELYANAPDDMMIFRHFDETASLDSERSVTLERDLTWMSLSMSAQADSEEWDKISDEPQVLRLFSSSSAGPRGTTDSLSRPPPLPLAPPFPDARCLERPSPFVLGAAPSISDVRHYELSSGDDLTLEKQLQQQTLPPVFYRGHSTTVPPPPLPPQSLGGFPGDRSFQREATSVIQLPLQTSQQSSFHRVPPPVPKRKTLATPELGRYDLVAQSTARGSQEVDALVTDLSDTADLLDFELPEINDILMTQVNAEIVSMAEAENAYQKSFEDDVESAERAAFKKKKVKLAFSPRAETSPERRIGAVSSDGDRADSKLEQPEAVSRGAAGSGLGLKSAGKLPLQPATTDFDADSFAAATSVDEDSAEILCTASAGSWSRGSWLSWWSTRRAAVRSPDVAETVPMSFGATLGEPPAGGRQFGSGLVFRTSSALNAAAEEAQTKPKAPVIRSRGVLIGSAPSVEVQTSSAGEPVCFQTAIGTLPSARGLRLSSDKLLVHSFKSSDQDETWNGSQSSIQSQPVGLLPAQQKRQRLLSGFMDLDSDLSPPPKSSGTLAARFVRRSTEFGGTSKVPQTASEQTEDVKSSIGETRRLTQKRPLQELGEIFMFLS